MRNVIIRYSKSVSIARFKVTAPSTADITNYYDSTDVRYQDFTTLGVKAGDVMYWRNPYKKDMGYSGLEELGPIATSGSNASKFALQAHAPTQTYDATQADGYFPVVIHKEKAIVSYPLNLYRGARTASNLGKGVSVIDNQDYISYSDSLVSLFFERAPGYLDEIRINIREGQGYRAICDINKFFNKKTDKDVLFEPGNMSNISNTLLSVDKILSSTAPS